MLKKREKKIVVKFFKLFNLKDMKHINILTALIIFAFTIVGCDKEIISEKNSDNIHALLLTKSVPVICIDVYVTWNGQFIYLGTACTSGEGGGEVSSGNPSSGSIGAEYDPDSLFTSSPYDPGGNPDIAGGGGGSSSHYNSTTHNQEYKFGMLDDFYKVNSNLNLVQKAQVNNLITDFFGTNSGRYLYNYMHTQKVNITFTYDSSINTDALYDCSTNTIKIKDPSSLRINQIGEEMVHAAQHQIFYGNSMTPSIKNYEFEAKVFFDLSAIVDNSALANLPTVTDPRDEFVTPYNSWINDLRENNGRFTDIDGFNSLCELWHGYQGRADSSFTPLLLLYLFRKPIPPQPPLF